MSNKKKTILMNAYNVIKQMPDKDLKKYGIEMTPYDGMTDHDLLVNISKKYDEDHQILINLSKKYDEDHQILINISKKYDEDHQILINLSKKYDNLVEQQQSDHKLLLEISNEVKQINDRIDNLVTKNNLVE